MITNCYLSFEKYKALKDSNRLGELNLNNERVHQELCRLSLIDNLTYEFEWHYWMVVTFGFHPLRSDIENTLRTAHHRFDQWLRTNNKLSFMSVAQRSKWVCLRARRWWAFTLQLLSTTQHRSRSENLWKWMEHNKSGTKHHLWCCRKSKEQEDWFQGLWARRNKDRLRQSIYSTKEMTQRFIDENPHDDHFASFIRSWCDWQIQPLTKRSGKKIETIDDSSGTLEQFF